MTMMLGDLSSAAKERVNLQEEQEKDRMELDSVFHQVFR